MTPQAIVIGSGFSGLAAACTLAAEGYRVRVLEKNSDTGGRARAFRTDGFVFDMGPSWYWMPEVFEQFFARFGRKVSDYYELERLDPSYRVFFEGHEVDIPAGKEALKAVLEKMEPGAGAQLDLFLAEARVKYETGMGEFVWKPSLSVMEFADLRLLRESFRLQLFSNMSAHIRKYFKNPEIIQLLEFPVLFLGAKPERTPALYSMMNYADIELGTWYPKGGMYRIAEGMARLARELGVEITTSCAVESIEVQNGKANAVIAGGQRIPAEVIVGAADYHHIESRLIPEKYRTYSDSYWESRVMSPSSLLFYLGVNKKVSGLLHHNLFFDEAFGPHASEIYDNPKWPSRPLFYVCCNSKTDPEAAPEGMENLFILIPVAPGMSSSEQDRSAYLDMVLERLEKRTGESIRPHIIYQRSFAHEEFISEYNSFKGNAYGLANTLLQTAFLKPRMKSRKIRNLFFAGQLTVPGPGVPPSIISGQLAGTEANHYLQKMNPVTLES
jgi:phytoene desaturase